MIADIRHFFLANRKESLALIGLFIVSRIAIVLAGVDFDNAVVVNGQWQLINIELLKNRLLESLWYLHSQPPLYNLYTGIVIKLFPQQYGLVFHAIHLFIGFISGWLLYFTLHGESCDNAI
jgi:hypothetical protein